MTLSKWSTLLLALLSVCAPGLTSCSKKSGPVKFPAAFLIGPATAGFQVDMGCPTLSRDECADTQSDWYAYVTSPDTVGMPRTHIMGGDPAVRGPGHWELYASDYDLVKSGLKGNAFRMSLEWSRLFPSSTVGISGHQALLGAANQKALATYHAMFKAMQERGITPLVTLHHYTLPLWIHDGVGCYKDFQGCTERGWLDKDRTVTELAKFAGFAAKEFGNYVDWWATLNEPFAVVLSSWLMPTETRTNPPAASMQVAAAKTGMVAMIEAHARMVDAVRAADAVDADGDGVAARVGIVYAMAPVIPIDPARELDREAAKNIFYLWNLAFLDAVALGRLDTDLDGVGEVRQDLAGRLDYVGLNYKQSMRVEGLEQSFVPELSPLLTLNPITLDLSQVHPRGLYEMCAFLKGRYNLPIVITEHNGQGLWKSDEALETRRVVEAFQWIQHALGDGIDIRGYFYWAMMDNYEWNHGMNARLGLYAVDPDDPAKARIARSLVPVFARIAEAGKVPDDLRVKYPINPQEPPTGGVP